MSKTLTEIAQELINSPNKAQLIYAFNGTGKTRLCQEFKSLIEPDDVNNTLSSDRDGKHYKILYFSAFTEDLFYWDNDLGNDTDRKLKIQPNTFTDWILNNQGLDRKIVNTFQYYTNDKLTPHFNAVERDAHGTITKKANTEVTFTIATGSDSESHNIKISKGEESNFVWSVFYAFINEAIATLSIPEKDARDTQQFNDLKYIFIDDPVSSLDENHLTAMAVDLAELIKRARNVKFIVSTHNTYFFNVLYHELNGKICYLLEKHEDGLFSLTTKKGDSNSSYTYHLYLKNLLQKAVDTNSVERIHFMLLRNLYERTASFLGFEKWAELLPGEKKAYYNRIIQFTSHASASVDRLTDPSPQEKMMVKYLLEHIINTYNFWKQPPKDNENSASPQAEKKAQVASR